MNTRQLRHFLAVMDLGSIAAAAEQVHLSQPALSRSLRALEDELRVPLFDRHDRRLRPTPYALAYAERARRMVFDEREGARALALMRSGELGSLSFGMGSSIASTLLGPMVLQLLSAAPGLRLNTLVQSTDVLLAELQREKLDFFIGDVRAAEGHIRLHAQPLYPCNFGWFARAGHPLAGRPGLGIADLQRYPLVMSGYADESLLRRMAALYGLSLPVQDHFSASTNDVGTVLTLLGASDAIAPSTDVAVISALREGTLVRLDVRPALDLKLTLGIVQHEARTRIPAAELAFKVVRDHFDAVRREAASVLGLRGGRPTRSRPSPP